MITIEQMKTGEPASMGGELPVSRRCHNRQHALCRGSWTQYPDQAGPCECECHGAAGNMVGWLPKA